jgi:hypothetical protein
MIDRIESEWNKTCLLTFLFTKVTSTNIMLYKRSLTILGKYAISINDTSTVKKDSVLYVIERLCFILTDCLITLTFTYQHQFI